MSRRVRCRSCRTAFLTDDDRPAAKVACPKCGARQEPSPASAPAARPEASVFVPAEPAAGGRGGRRLALAGLAVLALGAVGLVVAWPALVRWWRPVPPDPVESVATAYLKALVDGDSDAAGRIGAIDLPPAIRSYRGVRRERPRDTRLRGSFAPITAFHARVNETYAYDPATGRFTPRNPLGAAAETLDALHEAKAKAEQDALAEKIKSGNPDDVFDAAEGLAKTFDSLAKNVLSPQKLIPSYKQLVDGAKPPLPPAERELVLDYVANRETWDHLLKRPFPTLKADGPFVLERAVVTTSVVDALGSSGDPPTTLDLTLTRFRLEGIDTGWRVTSARRAGASSEPPPRPGPSHAEPSRGSLPPAG